MFKTVAVVSTLFALCSAGYIPSSGLVAAPGLLAPALLSSGGYGGYGGGYGEINVPTPYSFGYDTVDEYGTRQSRQESSNGNGAVTGSYSYVDPYGITRTVSYIADELGFRAVIKTNEPGTETSAPASALVESSAPKAALAAPVPIAAPVLAAPILARAPALALPSLPLAGYASPYYRRY